MPTYEYRCAKCGDELEVFQTFAEKALTRHPSCGGKLAKVFSPAGIVLKGSGFYKTDNRNSSRGHGSKDSDNGRADSTAKSSETNGAGSGSSESGKSESGNAESGKSDSGKSDSGKSESGRSSSNGSNGSNSKPKKQPEARSA